MANVHRRGRGSPEGGQFTTKPCADDTSCSQLSLMDAAQPEIHDGGFGYLSTFRRSGKNVNHSKIAASQIAVADTAAELWYSQTSHPCDVTHDLRKDTTYEDTSIWGLNAELAKSLQKSILASMLDEPIEIYRGVKILSVPRAVASMYDGEMSAVPPEEWSRNEQVAGWNSLQPGDQIIGEGFWSTSTEQSTAISFAGITKPEIDELPVLFRIETNVGKFLPASSPLDGSYEFYKEHEVLLPHGAVYEVTNVEILTNDMPDETPDPWYSFTDEPEDPENYEQASCYRLVSLRYVETPPEAQDLQILDNMKKDDSWDEEIAEEIADYLMIYDSEGLPIGGATHPKVIAAMEDF